MIEVTFLTNNGRKSSARRRTAICCAFRCARRAASPSNAAAGSAAPASAGSRRGLSTPTRSKPKERKHLTEEQFPNGYRMACQTFLNGDVSVSWEIKRP